MSNLIIEETDYKQILTALGYPILQETDFGIVEENIKDLFILHVLKNIYFKWFPLKEEDTYAISTNFSIDFPDSNTFGIVDARLVRLSNRGSIRSNNPLINEANIKIRAQSGYANKWDTGNDYGFAQVENIERSYQTSLAAYNKAVKKWVDYETNQLKGYSNISGDLSVTWAKYSENFNDVPHKFKNDVIKLSQSYLLEYFGRLRNQGTADLPTELTGDDFIDKAETLKDEVMEKFKQYTKSVVLRG